MNKDRGTIKWTALMLPEHTARLQQWRAEREKVLPIELADWQLADIEQTLQYSYLSKRSITVTAVYLDALQTFTGIVTKLVQSERRILLACENEFITLSIDAISSASVDDVYD